MDITNYTQYISQTNTKSDASIKKTVGKDYSSATEKELMDACKEFEAYFIQQVMKEVKNTVNITEFEDTSMSQLTDYYMDEVMSGVSKQIADTGKMGLAEQIFQQMKRNYDIE